MFKYLPCDHRRDACIYREAEQQPVCAREVKSSREIKCQADRDRSNKDKCQCIRQVAERGQQAVEQYARRSIDEGCLKRKRVGQDKQ